MTPPAEPLLAPLARDSTGSEGNLAPRPLVSRDSELVLEPDLVDAVTAALRPLDGRLDGPYRSFKNSATVSPMSLAIRRNSNGAMSLPA